jgi:hypothetical protein
MCAPWLGQVLQKLKNSEQNRMSIFDAATAGVAYFARRQWAKRAIVGDAPSVEG